MLTNKMRDKASKTKTAVTNPKIKPALTMFAGVNLNSDHRLAYIETKVVVNETMIKIGMGKTLFR
jgi:hypothetical protein